MFLYIKVKKNTLPLPPIYPIYLQEPSRSVRSYKKEKKNVNKRSYILK